MRIITLSNRGIIFQFRLAMKSYFVCVSVLFAIQVTKHDLIYLCFRIINCTYLYKKIKVREFISHIVDAIPREWRQMIIQNTQHVPPYISDTIYLSLVNSEITLSKVSSKLLYKAFKSRKQVPPTAQIKFKTKFSHIFRLTGMTITLYPL